MTTEKKALTQMEKDEIKGTSGLYIGSAKATILVPGTRYMMRLIEQRNPAHRVFRDTCRVIAHDEGRLLLVSQVKTTLLEQYMMLDWEGLNREMEDSDSAIGGSWRTALTKNQLYSINTRNYQQGSLARVAPMDLSSVTEDQVDDVLYGR